MPVLTGLWFIPVFGVLNYHRLVTKGSAACTTEGGHFIPVNFTPLWSGGTQMRVTEKAVAVIILALSAWAILMWAATSFHGDEVNRILRVE